MKHHARRVSYFALVLVTVLSASIASAQTYAYVTESIAEDVLVFDAFTYAQVATVNLPSGTEPNRMVTSPDQERVYVVLSNGGAIAVLETDTNTFTTIPVASTPNAIDITPDGAFVYVASAFAGTIEVIDTATDIVVSTIPIPEGPADLAITPDGASVYVATFAPAGVTVLSTPSHTVTATIPLPEVPVNLAITPDGASVYASAAPSDLYVIGTATNTLAATISGAGGGDVAISPDGAAAYVAAGALGLRVIDTGTNTVSATIPGSGIAGTVAVRPDGAFAWVATGSDETVDVFDTAAGTLATVIPFVPSPPALFTVVNNVAFASKPPTRKDQCKNGGWKKFTNPGFTNQGECIKYVNLLP